MTHMNDPYDGPVPAEHKEFYTKLGARFRAARTARGMTLRELAAAAKITPEQLEKYENAELIFPLFDLLPMMQYMNNPPELDHLGQD